MELRVIDFDVLTRNFKPYVDGYRMIESEKRSMLDIVNPVRKEMETIISRQSSGLVIDELTQKSDVDKFKELQERLMRMDSEFKIKLKEMNDELNTSVYDQLSSIVSKWCTENNINLAMGKMEVIFNTDDIDITQQIIDVVKDMNLLFVEEIHE